MLLRLRPATKATVYKTAINVVGRVVLGPVRRLDFNAHRLGLGIDVVVLCPKGILHVVESRELAQLRIGSGLSVYVYCVVVHTIYI